MRLKGKGIMSISRRESTVFVTFASLILLSLLSNQPTFAAAKDEGKQPTDGQAQPVQQQQNPPQQQQQVAQATQLEIAKISQKMLTDRHSIKVKSLSDLKKSSDLGWQIVKLSCADTSSVECAQAAVAEVNLECTDSGKFFRKGSTTWTWINFSMITASSVFTGLGASTTLASAKVFSTLGASTALGAVATTATTNGTSDQGGLLAIGTTLDNFLKFVQTGGDGGKPADSDLIYMSAPIYAAKCTSAAASTGH